METFATECTYVRRTVVAISYHSTCKKADTAFCSFLPLLFGDEWLNMSAGSREHVIYKKLRERKIFFRWRVSSMISLIDLAFWVTPTPVPLMRIGLYQRLSLGLKKSLKFLILLQVAVGLNVLIVAAILNIDGVCMTTICTKSSNLL